MACFVVPAAEAVVTTVANHFLKKKEAKSEAGTKFSGQLGILNKMLWGGSGLLAFEHLWHGEIAPVFPFLTATENPESTAQMLHEMATSGVGMAAIVTLVWVGMVLVNSHLLKNSKALQTDGDIS